jgi:hypothetical protein
MRDFPLSSCPAALAVHYYASRQDENLGAYLDLCGWFEIFLPTITKYAMLALCFTLNVS